MGTKPLQEPRKVVEKGDTTISHLQKHKHGLANELKGILAFAAMFVYHFCCISLDYGVK